jgi:hypothetical protein
MLDLYADIFKFLETELRDVDYVGPLGIDAFVYRDATGQPRLKPDCGNQSALHHGARDG